MPRTITVKGSGKAAAKPDYAVLSITLEAKNMDYEAAMDQAGTQLEQLKTSLTEAGFERDAVKTANFNVRTEYRHTQDERGNYRNEFDGYVVSHALKLSFDLDTERLNRALSTIASSLSNPQLNIVFSVKDSASVNDALLQSAAENARKRADVLCAASGVKLGALLSIDYTWGERGIFSRSAFDMSAESMPLMARAKAPDILPEDIDYEDEATFVWEIQD